MSSCFWYQPFVAVSGNVAAAVPVVDDVLSSHEQEKYPNTSLDENLKYFDFQTDRNYFVGLRQTNLAVNLTFVTGRGYEPNNTNEVKKEHQEEAKSYEGTAAAAVVVEEQEADVSPALLSTHVNNILHSIFSNGEVYINNQQIYNSNGSYAHKSYISNNFKGAISKYKGVLDCEVHDYEEFPDEIMEAPLSEPFSTRRFKMLIRPDCFILYGNLDFFSTSELLYPNMKIELRPIRARPTFYMISDNPNVSLAIVHCSLYTRHIALKDDYHKK